TILPDKIELLTSLLITHTVSLKLPPHSAKLTRNTGRSVLATGMDYQMGLPDPRAHELRGPPKPEPLLEVAVMYLLFVVVFGNLLLALIECTCAVLENVYVRQGRNYRQCSQRGCTGARREEGSQVKQALQNYNLRTYDGQSVN